MEIQLAIVDDDSEFPARFADFAERTVGFARPTIFRSAAAARRGLARHPFDIVLLDVALGRSTGCDLIREIRQDRPATRLVVVSDRTDDHLVTNAFAQGADGYLLKSRAPGAILDVLLDFFRGGVAVDARILATIVGHLRADRSFGAAISQLSGRENAILRRLSCGDSYKDIAIALELSPQTVYTHAKSMFRKLGVGSKTEAVARFLRPGATPAEPELASPMAEVPALGPETGSPMATARFVAAKPDERLACPV